ncbi:hypothetical protein HNY73_013661 [Argiope bruennichi]|uniref:Uncharacterized protein n=1 Tax=Argiope bruennichi TaxID=94029 RepID=A0A8T0F0Z0_ARGBR|nr:hypothetical protein HNY73_013661 [Argiope bruennichi]
MMRDSSTLFGERTTSEKQALLISKLTKLGDFPVQTALHKTLNFSRGVISEPDLIDLSDGDLVTEFSDQQGCYKVFDNYSKIVNASYIGTIVGSIITQFIAIASAIKMALRYRAIRVIDSVLPIDTE